MTRPWHLQVSFLGLQPCISISNSDAIPHQLLTNLVCAPRRGVTASPSAALPVHLSADQQSVPPAVAHLPLSSSAQATLSSPALSHQVRG